MGFPFTFFRHGEVNLDSKLKNAEGYVVFTRDPTAGERLAIQSSCPEPIAGMFTWGDRFAYFGSGGDTFDFDVLAQFGGPKVAKMLESEDYEGAMNEMEGAMAAFVKAHDAWLEKVHGTVPIAFAEAATSTSEDAWGEWSASRVDEALAALSPIRSSREELKWIATRVNALLADAPVDSSKMEGRLAAATAQLEGIDVPVPIERLTSTEHDIHTAGESLGAVLERSTKAKRAATLASISPRARLVYYASYTALRNGDLVALKDIAKALGALAAKWPAQDRWRAAQLVGFAAANLAHVTPGFDKPDAKGAKAAIPIFELAIALGARDEETFDAALSCARAAKDKRALVLFANAGIDATRALAVANEAAKHAKALKDAKSAKTFAARAKAITASSTIAQSGNVAKMKKQLESGGEPTPDLLGNLALLWGRDPSADKKSVLALVARLADTLVTEPSFGMHRGVALNFGMLAGNHGFYERVIDVLGELFSRGLSCDDEIALTFSYSGAMTKNDDMKQRVAERLSQIDPSDQTAQTYENLAEIRVALKDHAHAIEALRAARELRHPNFAKLREEKAFLPLRGNAEFEALF